MARAGSCSAKCSRNNSKSIAKSCDSNRQVNLRRVQSLDDVAKTEHRRALYRLFPGVNDMRIARERCLLRCVSPFMALSRLARANWPCPVLTYQTPLGFYDLAIAAPSMKAALEAWGAGGELFHQGFAKETDDPDVVAATMKVFGNLH